MIKTSRKSPWLIRLLSCIRYDEVLVLQGSPLFGAIFSINNFHIQNAWDFLLLVLGNAALVAHVFLFNDWMGIEHDLNDMSRSARVFLNRGIRQSEIAGLSLILLALSLIVFSQLNSSTLIIGFLIATTSVLYSAPAIYLKGVPILSSALHAVSGWLHFLLGYSVFHEIDGKGLIIGSIFATIFTAGHLTQEVRDFEPDLQNGIKTNAVVFGHKNSFIAGFLLFTFAKVMLILLAIKSTIPYAIVLVGLAIPLHFYWSLQAINQGLTGVCVRQFQRRYRLLYASIGAIMVISVFLKLKYN